MVTKIEEPIIVQGNQDKNELGMTHIITGDGKGKTTASLGLALRAVGNNYSVYIIQFLKSGGTGEMYAAKHLPNLSIVQYGVDAIKERKAKQMRLTELSEKDTTGRFTFNPDSAERNAATEGFIHAKNIVASQRYDIVILDEVNCIADKGFIPTEEIITLMKNTGKTELLLTGRDAPEELYEHADYVSVVDRVKHPWDKRIKARKGIEY